MGVIVISAYKPKPGKDAELLEAVKTHVPILRELSFATNRPVTAMKAIDGTILEVFEWVSQDAINAAHKDPAVHKMWGEFEACCEYVKLIDVAECAGLFAEFTPVEL